MSGRTMVRLISVGKCDYDSTEMRSRNIHRFIGQMIPILLSPIKPDARWLCGTQMVWEVAPDFLHVVYPGKREEDGRRFVCEHQIELD